MIIFQNLNNSVYFLKNISYNKKNVEKSRKWRMEQCRLTITTVENGEESSILRVGKMQLTPLSAQISYKEADAIIHLSVENNSAQIERKGDYTLSLPLREKQLCKGRIGIMGSEGDVEVFAHKVSYSISRNSLLLSLHYDLIFGEEKQEMKLRILSRLNR